MLDAEAKKVSPGTKLLGDWQALAVQLGCHDGLVSLASASSSSPFGRVRSVVELRDFLEDYQIRLLIPVEMPAIYRAFWHARRGEVRELICLDQELARQPLLREFARASRRVGQSQLKRLRPMRDQRLIKRYLQAVEAGEAHGWHTLVYGLTLHLYALPICQGLASYAQQTLRGFIRAAAPSLQLSEPQCQALQGELVGNLSQPIQNLLNSPERTDGGTREIGPP